MPLETKKVLWTVLSVVIVLVVTSGVALALVYPRGADAGAPATVAAVAPPRSASPDEYVRTVEPAPVPAPPDAVPQPAGSDIIIVYGDKPAPSAMAATAQPGTTASREQTVYARGRPPRSRHAAAQPPRRPSPSRRPSPPRRRPWPSTGYRQPLSRAAPARTTCSANSRRRACRRSSPSRTSTESPGTACASARTRRRTRRRAGWRTIRKVAGCAEAYVSKQTVQRSS